MADKKWRFEYYDAYDYTGMLAQLEKMAEKGWILDKVQGYFWRYRQTEPGKVNYAVTHFENYTAHESAPDNGQSEFLEMCASAGWQLVAQQNSFMVFVNYSDNPVPLETDAVTQVETVHKSVKNQFLGNSVTWFGILMLHMISEVVELVKRTYIFVNYPANLFIFFAFLTYAVVIAAQLHSYNKWHKKAVIMAEETNTFLPTKTNRLPFAMVWMVVLVVYIPFITGGMTSPLFLGGIYMALVAAAAVYQHLSDKNISHRLVVSGAVLAVSIVVLWSGITLAGDTPIGIKDRDMPVTIQKMGIDTDSYVEDFYESTVYKSVLFDKWECEQSMTDSGADKHLGLEYYLVKSDYSFIMDNLRENYDYGWPQQDAEQWKADEVIASIDYEGGYSYYIAHYDNMMLRFMVSQPLTDSQIEFVVEKLIDNR